MKQKRATKAAMFCYGFGDLASQFVWTFTGTYLTIFYTDIVGLAPGMVSAIVLIARIWDAVNDPMMGAIAERTHSRFGRFRPYLAIGSPILALFGVLVFTNPFGGTSATGILWAAITYILAGMVYTFINIPYGALAGVMTEDPVQRNVINTSRSIGMNIGMIIVNVCSPVLLLAFSGKGAEVATVQGYTGTAALYGVIAIPLFLLVFATAREWVRPKTNTKKFSVKEIFLNLVKNKYLMILVIIMLLQMTAFMGRMAVISYYAIYCLNHFALISALLTIPSVCGAICSFAVPFLAGRIGKRNVLMISMIVQACGLLFIFIAPYNKIWLILLGTVVFGMFHIGFPMTLSMLADAVDYMEEKTGVRTDGTAYAIYGLATKAGNAIGAAAGLLLLSAFGYVANQPQTEQAMRGINIVTNLIPAILFFAGAFCCLMWDLKSKETE